MGRVVAALREVSRFPQPYACMYVCNVSAREVGIYDGDV